MEDYFLKFRKQIIGIDQTIDTPFGKDKKIVYADWTASGRNYAPIEERMRDKILPSWQIRIPKRTRQAWP